MTVSFLPECSQLRVSSVLNRNSKEYGKQFMIDGCDDTCWNSDQGTPQWIQLEFNKALPIDELHLQFQGGFAGKECWIEVRTDGVVEKLSSIYPQDSNSIQVFILPKNHTDLIKIVFNSSTDFFGRVILYRLDVKGKP